MGRPPQTRRRQGQALVEFTISFLVFITVFFSVIEFSLAFNVLVSLNSVAAHSALVGTGNDPMGVTTVKDVKDAVTREASHWGLINQANLTTDVDLNHQTATGTYHTRVTCHYQHRFSLLPMGSVTFEVSSVRVNEIQMYRP